MYYKTGIERTHEKEILASEKTVSFTGTVVPDGVEADADGRKIVHKGSLIAASGKVVTVTAGGTARTGETTQAGETAPAGGTISFSEDPAGILLEAVDVTYGAQPGAILVEGYVIGERLPLGVEYTAAVGAAIHEKLPEIKFR